MGKRSPEFDTLISPEPNSGCWLWLGAVNNYGYGRYRGEQAHRVALRMAGIVIPAGMEPDHLCRVPCCVNPTHLEIVTHRENIIRGSLVTTARQRTHCGAGHALTDDNIEVRQSPGRIGWRYCKECKRLGDAVAYKKRTENSQTAGRHLGYRQLSGQQKQLIRELLSAGLSHSKITQLVGYSIATISRVRNGKYKRQTKAVTK